MERLYCILIGYVFGLFQTAFIYGKLHGIDIRNYGSGNAGTTNTLRVFGTKAGLLVLFGDIIKTILAVVLCGALFGKAYPEELYLLKLYAATGAILGHNFPFYLHFKGGKGIAVSAAVIVASSSNTSLGWIMIGVFLAVFIIVVGITRYVSLGSLIVVWYFPLYVILEYHRIETSLFVIMLFIALLFTALAYFKHAGNIRRLMNHTERKLGEKKEKENE